MYNGMREIEELIQGIGIIGIVIGTAIITINAAPALVNAATFELLSFQSPFLFDKQVTRIGAGIAIWGIVFITGLPYLLYSVPCFLKDLLIDKIDAIRGYKHL